jgi:glycosyltransferase involved in cell wall biosynthesis
VLGRSAVERDRPLRVVHLVTRSHRRGAEVFALELAAASDVLGHENEVFAIALAADGDSIASLPVLVPTRKLGLRAYVQSSWRLRRLLKAEPADVVLAHGGWAALVVAFAVPGDSAARVWQRILGLPLERWGSIRRGAWRVIARRFDGVVALTPDMESEMRELGYEGPVWPIGNARDPARFTAIDRDAASAALRAEVGVGPEVPLLGFVGHLVDQKHPELAIDVLAEVRRQGHPAHLVIAGDGPRRRHVQQRIHEHGVEKYVTLLGHRDDPELIFGGSDLVLITSRAEGIPGVAIEAQMTGCPVVTFLLGAVEDVVEDGVTGVVVAWPEPQLMAARVSALLADPHRMQAMSDASIPRAAAFTTASTAGLYVRRFEELRAGRQAASAAVTPG